MSQRNYFNDAGRDLQRRLGIPDYVESSTGTSATDRPIIRPASMYSHLNVIHEHASGGKIYVGNQTASSTLNLLQSHGITHVVNCTHGFGELPNHFESSLSYFRFPISDWRTRLNPNDKKSVEQFVAPLFEFIDSAIGSGKSVLVHCLAGAHRAGTTGCACLIHYEQRPVADAIRTAKSRRPIIDPICDFPHFLEAVANVKLKK